MFEEFPEWESWIRPCLQPDNIYAYNLDKGNLRVSFHLIIIVFLSFVKNYSVSMSPKGYINKAKNNFQYSSALKYAYFYNRHK